MCIEYEFYWDKIYPAPKLQKEQNQLFPFVTNTFFKK